MKVPVHDLLLPASRLNTVAPMSHDYYRLSPNDPPRPTAPQKQDSVPQESEAPPVG